MHKTHEVADSIIYLVKKQIQEKRVCTIDQVENTLGEVLETKGQGQGDLHDFILPDPVRRDSIVTQ